MAFFALGIEQMLILENRELFGRGEIKFWSFASDENANFFNFDQFRNAMTDERRALTKSAIESITQTWEGATYQYVPDNARIRFGDTGKILFQTNYIPEYFHWTMFGIESDQDIRELGVGISNFFTDDRIDEVSGAILTVAGASASPVTAAAVMLAKAAMEGATTIMKKNKDDQVMIIDQSFIRRLHYPMGTRYAIDIASAQGNVYYDYFLYGYEE